MIHVGGCGEYSTKFCALWNFDGKNARHLGSAGRQEEVSWGQHRHWHLSPWSGLVEGKGARGGGAGPAGGTGAGPVVGATHPADDGGP